SVRSAMVVSMLAAMAAKCCSSPAIKAGSALCGWVWAKSKMVAPSVVRRARTVILHLHRGLAASPGLGYNLEMEGSQVAPFLRVLGPVPVARGVTQTRRGVTQTRRGVRKAPPR